MRRAGVVSQSLRSLAVLCVFAACALSGWGDAFDTLRSDFANPPLHWKSRPLWFWNAPETASETRAIMEGSKRLGYYGFGILPAHDKEQFMSEAFLDRYGEALDVAAELGLKMCLYDEYWFPSGSAGGQLAAKYPEALSKRLDMVEVATQGPGEFSHALPGGEFMGAVAMHTETRERIDITGRADGEAIRWEVPQGEWRVMLFSCVPDGSDGLVDYLDPESVGKFISLTYERYYERFAKHFGTTIDSAFFDEPTLYRTLGARTWTPKFNALFEQKYGFSPVPYYPALWCDIGPDTAAARNALFGFRAQLYAEGFPKTVNAWCRAHGIQLTGHHDQEEIVNPTGICGDLIKSFEHQDIPGIDQIGKYGRASKVYKVVSSASYNYDRPLVMTECYGAMDKMPVPNLYMEAIDQFAKGINVMIPHAVWYDAEHIQFDPELSHRTEPYASALPAYNEFIGRLQCALQRGRHVADIAVLYPIATLEAGYYFGTKGNPYLGGPIPEEADYLDVGEQLSLEVRRDFTFLHPEALQAKCAIDGPRIVLENAVNREEYRVLILPGATTIEWEALRKAKEFYERGGKIIATTRLPYRSAEFGKDADVRQAVIDVFGIDPAQQTGNQPDGAAPQSNNAGGMARFVGQPTVEKLKAALDEMLPNADVKIETASAPVNGNLSYIHKVVEGRDVYFIGNSGDTPLEISLQLRGSLTLELWDPHTGTMTPVDGEHAQINGEDCTRVRVALPPVQARMFVGKQ
jgi:hypothetical protein